MVKCLLQLKRSQWERERDGNQQPGIHNNIHNMDIFFPPTDTSRSTRVPCRQNPVNLKSCSVRFGHVHIPSLRHRSRRWINKSCSARNRCETDICRPSLEIPPIDSYPWSDGDVQMELTFHLPTPCRSATYSEGERQLPIGLAGWVQVDILPLPALVVRALALWEERRDTNRGVRAAESVC